jgi:biotin synthase
MQLCKEKIVEMLNYRGENQEELFALARRVREENNVKFVIRGTIEVSSYCRKNCEYCPMALKNKKMARFILSQEQILNSAREIFRNGISVLFLQSGEDPRVVKIVGEILPEIQKIGFSKIILNFGDLPDSDYEYLKRQGATGYILKQESSNEKIHFESRGYNLGERISCLESLFKVGFDVGMGSIIGLKNQFAEEIAEDILLSVKYKPKMVSVTPLIPAKETSYSNMSLGNIDYTLNTISILRILNPNANIPTVSALQKIREGGQVEGFDAGANLITVNFTPKEEQSKYPIYGHKRYIVKLNYAKDVLKNKK